MVTTVADKDIQALYNQIQKTDKEYQEMISKLNSLWSDLDSSVLSNEDKMKNILAGEYLLTKLRVSITDEQFRVKSILGRKDVAPTWIAIFKQRDMTLATYSLKLTDLRTDVEILSKVAWYSRTDGKFVD